jgi:hypothetical protein
MMFYHRVRVSIHHWGAVLKYHPVMAAAEMTFYHPVLRHHRG